MLMKLKERLFSFFDTYCDTNRPILLALSGGADSVFLLHLLVLYKKLDVHLVHVNHGWRKESVDECNYLQDIARSLSLPFHTTTFDPKGYKGNLEEESRNERLAYFQKVCKETGAQGIFLAQHADDQAETVFKRVLEGSSLVNLRAMTSVSHYEGMQIFRPLLDVTKNEIQSYLQDNKISYFTDPTNEDTRFLRARMRKEIFPQLRTSFGKAFDKNLCQIAREAELLAKYLDAKIAPYLESGIHSKMGWFFEKLPTEEVELHHFIKKVSSSDALSRDAVSALIDLLGSKKANKRILGSFFTYIVDRGMLFVVREETMSLPAPQPLCFGVQQYGPWTITVSKGRGVRKNHWKDLFSGSLQTVIPEGQYLLFPGETDDFSYENEKKAIKILRKYFTEKRVPHFLLKYAPMIVTGSTVFEDFVTGSAKIEPTAAWCVNLSVK